MRSYVVRRLVATVIVFWAVLTLVFMFIQLTPGNIVLLFTGTDATPEQRAEVMARLGLDQPLLVQYWRYLVNVLQGDLGQSNLSLTPVTELIADRAIPTLQLALSTGVAATLVAMVLGLIAAARYGGFLDGLIRVASVVAISIPNFWLGLLLLMVFGLYITDVLPAGGWIHFAENPAQNLLHLILPSFVLGLATIAIVTKTLRASMLDTLQRDYVTFARSMGLQERRVVGRVALPNAIIPTTTVIGLLVGFLVSGSVIVETVFTIPGVGQLMVDSFRKQDIPVAVGATLFTAVFFLVLNFAVDILYAYFNPKIRELYLSTQRA